MISITFLYVTFKTGNNNIIIMYLFGNELQEDLLLNSDAARVKATQCLEDALHAPIERIKVFLPPDVISKPPKVNATEETKVLAGRGSITYEALVILTSSYVYLLYLYFAS